MELNGIHIDLEVAIKHVKSDLRDDWFPDVFDYEDILNLDYVSNKLKEYKEKRYYPSFPLNFNIPKSGFTLRYSTEITIIDKIVYQALVNNVSKKFDSLLSNKVYSFRINKSQKNKDKKYFFQKGVNEWRNFNSDVRLALEEVGEGGVLLITDITNFYENISINKLHQDLEVLCEDLSFEDKEERRVFDGSLNALVYTFLGKITMESDLKGLPQNREASSFLANMFLASVDYEMVDNYDYYRYADDIKIVCKNKFEARKALRSLIVELRKKGLNVNNGKTYIINNDNPSLNIHLPLENKFMETAEGLIKSKKARALQSVVPMLKKRTLELIETQQTEDREFKFCINRLARISRNEALKSLVDISEIIDVIVLELREQPWSSDYLIRFLKSVDMSESQIDTIVNIILDENKNIYSWQSYLLWQLLVFKEVESVELIKLARKTIEENISKPEVAGALLYLGSQGKSADKMKIIESFGSFTDFFTQRNALIAVKDLSDKILEQRVEPRLLNDFKGLTKSLSKLFPQQFYKPLPPLSKSDIFIDLPEAIS